MTKDDKDMVVVIMAGGAGTRFWPVSTAEKPKQFLKLFGDRSLLQKSYDRVAGFVSNQRILVLTNADFVELVREQLPEIPPENVLGEPFRRDTAAAVCLGAVLCRKRFGDPIVITLTADHMIEPVDLFQRTILSAVRQAGKGPVLYTLGIEPTFPATGYGYLELGQKLDEDDGIVHYRLKGFKEKPDIRTARDYVESGRFQWNSGMFVWKTKTILAEMERQLPQHLNAISEAVKFDGTPQWHDALKKAFEPLETVSIDYGVMEGASGVQCVGCTFSWSDVGGWLALEDYLERDRLKNAYRGKIFTLDASGNLIFCEDTDETVMLTAVKDLVIVRAGKRTLIAPKDRIEEIKDLVKKTQDKP